MRIEQTKTTIDSRGRNDYVLPSQLKKETRRSIRQLSNEYRYIFSTVVTEKSLLWFSRYLCEINGCHILPDVD